MASDTGTFNAFAMLTNSRRVIEHADNAETILPSMLSEAGADAGDMVFLVLIIDAKIDPERNQRKGRTIPGIIRLGLEVLLTECSR